MASTPLPVVLPSSRAASSQSQSQQYSNDQQQQNPALRLSIPATPATSQPGSNRTSVDFAEEKNGQPPPPASSSAAAYAAAYPVGSRTGSSSVASTPLAVNVRTSNASLPPTRVGSPRGDAIQEEEISLVSPGASGAPSRGHGVTPGNAIPASRGGQGLTPHGIRPPIPHTRGPRTLTTTERFAACFKTPFTPSSIFEIQLTSLVDTYKRLPAFLDLSIEYLCQHLDESHEFFSSPVSELKLQELVNYLEDAGEGEINLQSLGYYGSHSIGTFLKRFLDQLPEPLLTYTRYKQFCEAANFVPVGGDEASGNPGVVSPHSPSIALRQAFPILTVGDTFDQQLLMQSLVVSLPGAHFLLVERLVDLWRRMIDFAALNSPNPHQSHGMGLQKLSLIFCSSILCPLYVPSGASHSSGESIRRAQEQQVVTYLVHHADEIFHSNPHRLLHEAPKGSTMVVDPNPELHETISKWRQVAGNLKLNFSRRHFDVKALVKAFRAWKGTIRTNRRVRVELKAEAYRQLALLKQELLAEKQKNVLLSRELYGLKEEYELRDFQDQLRIQTGSIGAHGYGVTRVPIPAAAGGKTIQEEKEPSNSAAPIGSSGLGGPQAHRTSFGVGVTVTAASAASSSFPRDLSSDLAAVRALQDQDRMLTQTYSRY